MEKKTLYALVALVALSALAAIVMTKPEKGERVGEKPRPVAEIKTDQVATLDISQPGGSDKVTLTRQGDKWQVTAPYNKPADQGAVKSVTEGLGKMRWGDIITQDKARFGEMEVSDERAIHVVAKDSGGQVLADLYLGKTVGSGTMVRVAGKDDVYAVSDLTPFNFKKPGKDWRDHVLFDLKADDAEKLSLSGGGTSVTLERLPPAKGADGKEGSANIFEAHWKVADGSALKVSGPLDDALINGLVQGVASLRAGDFVDDGKPDQLGLAPGAPGQIEVTVNFKGGKPAGLRIGSLKGDDYNAQVVDSGQIFTAKKFALERIAHLPQDVRDKNIVLLKGDDLDTVTVVQGNDTLALKRTDKGWKADKVAETDDSKAKMVADSFDKFSGSGFVAPGSPELASLAKPKAIVTLKPKSGAQVVIKIGDARGDDVAVQRVGQDAMWVKKYQTERFLKKNADVTLDKSKPAAPTAPAGRMPMGMPHGMPPHR